MRLASHLLLGIVCLSVHAYAQPANNRLQPAHALSESGQSLYLKACAACHGLDGKGAPQTTVAFEDPLPDFTDCRFSTREPDADWMAVVHDGGPARAFGRMMPAFGEALAIEQIERILGHIRTFCGNHDWPRGELNLPRPLVTEKAYPEDEAVLEATASVEGVGSIGSTLVYERRFGPRNQLEIAIPLGFSERVRPPPGREWVGGLGDVAVGVKRAMFHSLRRGSIFSLAGEVILPTGDEDRGLGKGTTVFEPFLAVGQVLPAEGFLQLQAGVELPADTTRAAQEAFWRIVVGRSISQRRWMRTWSPMIELLGARELEAGEPAHWDLVPQVQVTLSTRQHVLASVGVRLPVNDAGPRRTQLLFYVLWDWFDGPLAGGW